MTIRPIVTVPNPVLRRKARPVTAFDKRLQILIDDMIETMRAAPGVGLAAPQVSVSERVIVVEYYESEEAEAAEDQTRKKVWVVINPEIVKASPETVMGVEGCLSIPNVVGEVERHQTVHLKGLSRRGQPLRLKATGWLARIFQHEIDHLNGVLFTDRATRVWLPESQAKQEDRV